MRKILTVVVILMLTGGFVVAQGITGSEHDFSGDGWNTSGEICIVCHTPHDADAATGAPLWNHEVTATSFTIYSSTTLNATVGQPDGSSKLCLSCHDGTVAIDNFGGTTTGGNFVAGSLLLGEDISDEHPVSFTYDAALATADGKLFDPSTNSGLGGTIDDDLLSGGKMQCSSCHDVHDQSGLDKLLMKSNAGSALCLTCHNI